jgi:cytochrome c peroxidase
VRAGTELIGAMRTPSLRNLENTGPYMHQGQLETLADVLAHYNAAPEAMIGHSDIEPLGLSDRELEQLEAFLLTLAAPAATSERWLNPPAADTPLPLGD